MLFLEEGGSGMEPLGFCSRCIYSNLVCRGCWLVGSFLFFFGISQRSTRFGEGSFSIDLVVGVYCNRLSSMWF